MTEMQAALGLAFLEYWDGVIETRRAIGRWYGDHVVDFAKAGVGLVVPPEYSTSNWYKVLIRLPDGVDKAKFKATLYAAFNVGTAGDVFGTPLPLHPVFADQDRATFGPTAGSLDGTLEWAARHVCLPIYLGMNSDQVDYVCESVVKAVRVNNFTGANDGQS